MLTNTLWDTLQPVIAKEYYGVQGKACRDSVKQAKRMLEEDIPGDSITILVQSFDREFYAKYKLVNHCFDNKLENLRGKWIY